MSASKIAGIDTNLIIGTKSALQPYSHCIKEQKSLEWLFKLFKLLTFFQHTKNPKPEISAVHSTDINHKEFHLC